MPLFSEENLSEVAQMRASIELEEQSIALMRSGLMHGTTRHAYITARMEHIGATLIERSAQVGHAQAEQEAHAALDALADEVSKTSKQDATPAPDEEIASMKTL